MPERSQRFRAAYSNSWPNLTTEIMRDTACLPHNFCPDALEDLLGSGGARNRPRITLRLLARPFWAVGSSLYRLSGYSYSFAGHDRKSGVCLLTK